MEVPPDVIVVGAGIIGAAIAWRLAQQGASVELLDAGALGSEASWAGAGMLAPGGEFHSRSVWLDFALEGLRGYAAFVEELSEESSRPIDYRRSGAVEVALEEIEWQQLIERSRAQRSLGIASTQFGDQELRGCVPLLEASVRAAMFYPDDAQVDPRDVTAALRIACQLRGVRIREHTPVRRLHARAAGIEAETDAGTLASAVAVLAAGAWSSRIEVTVEGVPCPLPDCFPVRGHLLGYALEPGSLGPILRRGHTYLLQRSSGFTIAGTSSEEVGFDRRPEPQIAGRIAASAAGLAPALRAAGEPVSWIGFRPATRNGEPVIGRLGQSSLWLAYGHYRNGILLADVTARRVSREIIASSETGWRASSEPR